MTLKNERGRPTGRVLTLQEFASMRFQFAVGGYNNQFAHTQTVAGIEKSRYLYRLSFVRRESGFF
jgi:hypothetical protein